VQEGRTVTRQQGPAGIVRCRACQALRCGVPLMSPSLGAGVSMVRQC
jgi:hypothetical protein